MKRIDPEQTMTNVTVISSHGLSFKLSGQIANLTDKIILAQRLLNDNSPPPR